MAINPKYVIASDLESYFVDKLTGFPLRGGIITYYSDNDRVTKKPIYQIVSPSPGNYSYVVLPNPIILSNEGTFQDGNGNNIIPYYYPYDANGKIELYYITVTDANGSTQFTRVAWPNISASGSSGSSGSETNFIPNGQFVVHNNIVYSTSLPITPLSPPIIVIPFGSATLDEQIIAPGGWSFRRTHGGTSTFNNSFVRLSTGITGIFDFPRYAFNFVCTNFNVSDTFRDLTVQFANVNTFSGGSPTVGNQPYTFYFAGKSNDSNTYVMQVYLIQYFGTGGSPSAPIVTPLLTESLTPSYQSFNVPIANIPANAGTLGTNDDDYVAIAIRGPASPWSVQMTDFALVFGNVPLTSFPVETQAEMLDDALFAGLPIPSATGSDLYLPLVSTPSGLAFSHSEIGSIIASIVPTAGVGLLPCTGGQYQTNQYSTDGIPYSRLQALIYSTGLGLPIYGTGLNYVTAYQELGTVSFLVLTLNSFGVATVPTEGSTPTGMSFIQLSAISTTGYGVHAYSTSLTSIAVRGSLQGAVIAVADGIGTPSGFTFAQLINNANRKQVFTVSGFTTAAALAVGSGPANYWTFTTGLTAPQGFYVWYKVNGIGDNPAPSGFNNGIQINLIGSETAGDVAAITFGTLNGGWTYLIATNTGIPNNSFFTFSGNAGSKYYVWYNVNSGGTDPLVSGAQGIQVKLATGFTAAQASTATIKAINNFSFAVPDLRGMFLRGYDTGAIWDYEEGTRFGNAYGLFGSATVGTFEFDMFAEHSHTFNTTRSSAVASPSTGDDTFLGGEVIANVYSTAINLTGGQETVPVNANVYWYIKY